MAFVLVLGTGHVLPVATVVRETIVSTGPGAVAVELDQARLRALLEDRRDARGPMGILARLQERLSRELGGRVGEDMLAAREAAMALNVPLYCIDDPADATVRRAWGAMGWRERAHLLTDLLRTMRPGAGRDDIDRVLQGDPKILDEFRQRYPRLAREVLDARDERMATRVDQISQRYERVAVVVGDAHAPGVIQRLVARGHDVNAVRLADLLKTARQAWTVRAQYDTPEPDRQDH